MSTEGTKVYDLAEVTCNLGGIPLDTLGGWGEGDSGGIQIEKDTDDFSDIVGAAGDVVRSKTYDDRFKVTLTLLQTAGANKVLSGLLTLDKSATNGAGIVPLLLADRQGLNVLAAPEAWIMSLPKKLTFGPKAGNLEWVIRVANGKAFYGGN